MASKKETAIKKWVLERREKGISDHLLREELLKKGYRSYLVDRVLLSTSPEQGKKRNLRIFAAVLTIIATILVLFIGSSLFFSFSGCETDECFVSAVTNCDKASLEKDIANSRYLFKTEDCVVMKSLVEMGEDEPIEVKEFLEGKSMNCQFEGKGFEDSLLTSVSLGTENCEGDLKDNLDVLSEYI